MKMTVTELPALELPESLNYVAVFLTLSCHLNCSYCINDPNQANQRKDIFKKEKVALSPEEWALGLSRIPVREDLPITLQGGEPMVYWRGKGVGELLEKLPHKFDLLTAFPQKAENFVASLNGQIAKLQRQADYPSIRVSYHPEQMEKLWHGLGIEELASRCADLEKYGFRVSGDKADSDVGIYMVAHPENRLSAEKRQALAGKVPFVEKEFLGEHEGELFGTYLYPYSTNLLSSGAWNSTLSCECRTTELLLDPLGFVWGCHFHLYENWVKGGPVEAYKALSSRNYDFSVLTVDQFGKHPVMPVGHILDPDFSVATISEFRTCHHYGRCIGCDTKVKNNRFQSLENLHQEHTSVEIRAIKIPAQLQESFGHADPITPETIEQ